jgi:NADH-ubiquinone oxidoreductase chain 2
MSSIYLTYLDKGIGLYGGLFHSTSNTQIFHLFIFILSTVILQLTGFYPRKVSIKEFTSMYKLLTCKIFIAGKIINKMGEQFKIIEYPLIILFIVTGAIFLLSTSDLVSVFICIELQSYGLYLLSTIYRNSELATRAGLTYFLLGGLSSCFILLATGLLYANSGTTNLDGLYVITNLSDTVEYNNNANNIYLFKSSYINFSLLIMSVGFLFKVSAAPFHF